MSDDRTECARVALGLEDGKRGRGNRWGRGKGAGTQGEEMIFLGYERVAKGLKDKCTQGLEDGMFEGHSRAFLAKYMVRLHKAGCGI